MNHRLATLALGAAALAVFAAPLRADDCAFRAERRFDTDAAGLATLALSTGAGDLSIEGVPGLARIEVQGKACASSQALLDAIAFQDRREGEVQRVGTVLPEVQGGWALFGGGNYAWMDVHVRVPAALALDVRDSYGDIDIAHVGRLALEDSSGDIVVRDVAGDVRIADTSGDIRVEQVGGNVLIPHDSSGDIRIVAVRGNAEVVEDSSGDIAFERIEGSARVGSDSSGSIAFRHIGRNAGVDSDSSGDIEADDVGGDFRVARKSGGARNISHRNVRGSVVLPGG